MDGAIERRDADGYWQLEVDLLDFRPPRDYVAWDCLFGVRGTGDVERPLFADRGLPDDVSESVREAAVGDYQHSHTYVSWAEAAAPTGTRRSRPGPPGTGRTGRIRQASTSYG